MKRIICNILLAAALAAGFSAQAQRKPDLPYETSAFGADKVTKSGVTATVVDRRKATGHDRSGYVSIENTNDYPVRVNFKVYGVTSNGSRKLTTEKNVTVDAKKVHNEVCYYKENSENTFVTFSISISVTKQKTVGGPSDATVDKSPDKPISVKTPKAPGASGSGLIGKTTPGGSSGFGIGKVGSGSGIGKGGKLGNAPSVPGSGSGNSGYGSKGSGSGSSGSNGSGLSGSGSGSSGSKGASSSSDDYNSVMAPLKSGNASQSDYARALSLLSRYTDQMSYAMDKATSSSGTTQDELDKLDANIEIISHRAQNLLTALQIAYEGDKLNAANKSKYEDIVFKLAAISN